MQNLQLFIPEPCHENWHHMTPTDQGRFCNACAKEVVDFSMMTDTEVLNYFTTLTHEKVCGRALPSQLDRTICRPKDPKKRLFWYWNYIVMFFMFFGKGNTAKAQGGIKPVTEMSPVKANDIRGDVAIVVDGVKEGNRLITGKVIDIDGNPVSYASIKIKGATTGISADANGVYSISVKDNDVLIISGAGFKPGVVTVGSQNLINSVLDKANPADIKEVVVSGVFGGMSFRKVDSNKTKAVDAVKEGSRVISGIITDIDGNPVSFASIKIKGTSTGVSADANGAYSFKVNANVILIISAASFKEVDIPVGNQSIISTVLEKAVEGREIVVFSISTKTCRRKQKEKTKRSTETANPGKETIVRMGGVNIIEESKAALYVVDGKIVPPGTDINQDDVDDYSVLNAAWAMAIYGPIGANGAIVITTRKAKEIKLQEVVVNSEYGLKGAMSMAGGISYTSTCTVSILDDTIATIKTVLTDSIKIYPNPVQRNSVFSVQLKLKQTGNNYSMQITDASGRILLQQKFNAIAKDHTVKVMSDSRWAGGIYYIRIFDAKNQLISKKSFIVR